ncbi:MAG: LPS-assembly protein LptD [Bacteroidaceae bacterium]|nr:LPS-assembly protein LptD [Bacteroidaceae bacterium]
MRKCIWALLLFIVTVCITAVGGSVRYVPSIQKGTLPISVRDTIVVDDDSLFAVTPDSVYLKPLDSLRIAAKADTLEADTVKKKDSGLDQPVKYTARDSMTYNALNHDISLYGNSEVSYQDMNLQADIIRMNTDSSLVHATYMTDSMGVQTGRPVFEQGNDTYEMDKISYNFKTKKGYILNTTTEQGDGFIKSESSKRDADGVINLMHGTYTTCDADPPHFHIALSRAKVYPGKEVISGPAYLVVEGVPLPLAVPFGFYPFSDKYSSGFMMPSFGSETIRGFYLRDGGYYFAINDRIDLTLLGEIYTKGSWGLNASSTYKKRYKYGGNFYINYLNTVEGEKNMPDYMVTKSLKVLWTHHQDPKASVHSSFSASVNYASESFEKKNLSSLYNPLTYSQSTRTSSVSYTYTWPSIGLTLASSTNLSQNMRDSTIAMTLPDLNITLARFYPLKRKKLRGKEKWYEKISMSYTGKLSNSINTKEDKLLHSNLIKDWRNGLQHRIPISATFSLFKYINITPTLNFNDRMYTNKVMQNWDPVMQAVEKDTLYGFYNVYDWNASLSANTTLYGFYKPSPSVFGNKIIAVRHVLKPSVSFSYAPDFGSSSYGYYESYVRTDADGTVSTVNYSPFANSLYGVPGRGRTGSVSMQLSNNLEMKIRSDRDSTGERKISLIDELSGSLSYNMAAKTRKWSDLTTRLRLKLSKSYTFSMSAVWATYAYQFDEKGNVVVGDRTEWSYGRFGRFQGMSQNFSYTFSNSTFSKKKKAEEEMADEDEDEDYEDSNIDPELSENMNYKPKQSSKRPEVDEFGYLRFNIPWTLTVSYGITMRENTSARIREKNMRYPYKLTHTLNFSGNVRLSEGWNINYASGYDFNFKKLSTTTASLMRDLHCFSMSCSIVLMPYTSFNFTFRAKMSTLADVLKWEKRSSYSTNIDWY